MPVPRFIVLTNAKPGELPTEYLTDRDRFPAESLFTADLAKAHIWRHPPGVRRWVARHRATLKELAHCRRVWVAESLVKAARKGESEPAPAPAEDKPPVKPGSAARRHTVRSTKTDPNKRAKRAVRKLAVRKARKLLGKPRVRKPAKLSKVA